MLPFLPQHFKPTQLVCGCSRLVALAFGEEWFHVLYSRIFTELYDQMLAIHPDRVNSPVLWNWARAAKG